MYAMPLTHVAETVDPRAEDIQNVQGREAMVLRGKLLPLVRLSEVVGSIVTTVHDSGVIDPPGPSRTVPDRQQARVPVIVLELGDRRTGLIVDALVGQQEIVVKSFESPKGTLPVFAGATILGDGKPALILDAAGLT
jgi:two-component system chemotaxis sensor kinase CheA